MALSDKEAAQVRVEAARRALDDDLATLTDRLPAAAAIGQAGAAGGLGLAVLGAAAKQLQKKLSQRSDEKALTREAEIQAKAIAAAIAAAGLGAGPAPAAAPAAPAPAPKPRKPAPSPARAVAAVDAMTPDEDDEGGAPWGIILLLAALVAAIVAVVVGANDDEDLWSTPPA